MKPGENAGGLLAVAILAIILGTLAVALRLYTRKVVLNLIGPDDYLAVISWVSYYPPKRAKMMLELIGDNVLMMFSTCLGLPHGPGSAKLPQYQHRLRLAVR